MVPWHTVAVYSRKKDKKKTEVRCEKRLSIILEGKGLDFRESRMILLF